MLPDRNPPRGLAALRRMCAPRRAPERCELCAAALSPEHQHLVDPQKRRLLCACDACAILFDHCAGQRYRRVPREIRELAGFEIDEVFWNSLAIPIGLVFFFRSSASNAILAVYPSPGGATETSIEEDVWNELAGLHRSLGTLSDDVEALLVNRTKGAGDYYIVPIDECYKLTGILRQHWSGFSGGDRLWEEMRLFFDGLKQRAWPERNASHA